MTTSIINIWCTSPQFPEEVSKRNLCEYVDFINTDDMTSPVMAGRDLYNRRFLSVFCYISGDYIKEQPVGFTIFERYCDEWYAASLRNVPDRNGVVKVGGLTEEKLRHLIEFIKHIDQESFHALERELPILDRIQYIKLSSKPTRPS